MRIRKKDDDDVTLEMSPLIDCVFLLLIFFLVTTMMKKLEKQRAWQALESVEPEPAEDEADKADNEAEKTEE